MSMKFEGKHLTVVIEQKHYRAVMFAFGLFWCVRALTFGPALFILTSESAPLAMSNYPTGWATVVVFSLISFALNLLLALWAFRQAQPQKR